MPKSSQLFDSKGNKIGSTADGLTPNQTNIYDKHDHLIGTAVTNTIGYTAPTVSGTVGLTCLVIGLGVIPYVGLFVSIYSAWRIVTKGWESVSKGFKIFSSIMSFGWAVWSIWALYYASNIVHSSWDPTINGLIMLALFTQIPVFLILITNYFKYQTD